MQKGKCTRQPSPPHAESKVRGQTSLHHAEGQEQEVTNSLGLRGDCQGDRREAKRGLESLEGACLCEMDSNGQQLADQGGRTGPSLKTLLEQGETHLPGKGTQVFNNPPLPAISEVLPCQLVKVVPGRALQLQTLTQNPQEPALQFTHKNHIYI